MFSAALLFSGCVKDLQDRVTDLEDRVDQIEVDLKAAIKSIEDASSNGYSIVSYEALSDGSGYTFTLSNEKVVTVLNGKDGVDGGKGDKGDTGAPGAAGAAGAAGSPGSQGEKGEPGDTWFKNVTISATEVTFSLSDGREFTIPIASAFKLNITTDTLKAINGSVVELPYIVTNATEQTVVDCFVSGSYHAKVTATSVSEGVVEVTVPDEDSEAKLLVYADNGQGKTSIKCISFFNKSIFSDDVNVAVSADGGEFELTVTYNVECEVSTDAAWLHPVTGTKALVTSVFKYSADENTGLEAREADILVKAGDVTVQTFKVVQEAAHGIRDYADLLAFRDVTNSENNDISKYEDKNGVVKLLCDIDCSGSGAENEWTSICDFDIAATATNLGCEYGWSGVFDGQNHSIKNLTINQLNKKHMSGLFGTINKGTIKNLVFDQSCTINIEETKLARGSLFGSVASLNNGGTIDNIIFKGSIKLTHITSAGFMCFGGIVGAVACFEQDASVTNCEFLGTMSGESRTGSSTITSPRMGGIIGETMRCAASQSYAPKGDYHIFVTGCKVSGVLNLKGLRDGGIVGQVAGGAVYDNCKFSGTLVNNCENCNTGKTIYAVARVGGIAGYVEASETSYLDSFKNCSVEGTVVDLMQGQVGGLVGFTRPASYTDCTVNADIASKYYGDVNPLDETKAITYYLGVVVGNINKTGVVFSNVKGKGSVSKDYTTAPVDPVTLTAANTTDGQYLIGTKATGADISGITFWN